MRFIPYTIAILQTLASLVYCSYGQWRLAVIWFGVACSNAALAGIR